MVTSTIIEMKMSVIQIQKNLNVIIEKMLKPRWLVHVNDSWFRPFLKESNFFISRCSLALKTNGSLLLTCSKPRAMRS